MFGTLFGGGRFLDADLEDWQLETWVWLMRHLGGMAHLAGTPLVLPTRDFVPPSGAQGHDKAVHGLTCVKAAMGMGDWDCDLVAVERPAPSQRVGELWHVQTGGAAEGTFEVRGNRVVISYAADLVAHPGRLVPIFAHELAHYLLATVPEPPPGGEEVHELATELAVAYAGMGVLAANAAFSFQQFTDGMSQGWSASRSGYFSERSWAFALAVFLALTGRRGAADPWLKPTLRDMVRAADRYLEKRPALLAPLRSIP